MTFDNSPFCCELVFVCIDYLVYCCKQLINSVRATQLKEVFRTHCVQINVVLLGGPLIFLLHGHKRDW